MSNGGQQRGEPEPAMSLIFMGIFLFGVGWAIWHFFKAPILEALRWVRYGELWILNFFTGHRYDSCLDWLRTARFGETNPSPQLVQWADQCFGPGSLQNLSPDQTASYYALSADRVGALESGMMNYYRWPIAFGFGVLAIYTSFFWSRGKFKTKYTLETFIKVQARMWPVISPIVDFNPMTSARAPGSTVPDKLPLFAEALSPEEWISWHRIPVTNNIPDREATRRAFLLQLGPRWNGIAGQPPYIQALIAAYALKGVQKREESDDILGRISQCWSAQKGFHLTTALTAEIKGLINDQNVGGQALAMAQEHAYRTTALLGVLRWARSRGGVLAPAQFLWLRGTDRVLWYALNNLGRRSFHAEGAGAMAHFMAEQNAKKPLPIPRIDTAIVTLNQYLAERGQPIPPREEPAS